MNIGMSESTTKECRINDVETETFELFLQYCYRGWYWSGQPVKSKFNSKDYGELAKVLQYGKPNGFYCTDCGKSCGGSSQFTSNPFPRCSDCRCGKRSVHCALCKAKYDKTAKHAICLTCCEKHNVCPTIPQPVNFRLWKKFLARPYDALGLSASELEEYAVHALPKDAPSSDLMAHVRLFVFADRYNIEPLQKLCLFKLHRDLKYHRLDVDTIFVLVETVFDRLDAVRYEEDIQDLVTAYVACYAMELFDDLEFECMLGSLPSFAKKLVRFMACRRYGGGEW